jgi:hypothetical protein
VPEVPYRTIFEVCKNENEGLAHYAILYEKHFEGKIRGLIELKKWDHARIHCEANK